MDFIDKEDDHYVLSNKGIVASEIYGNEIFSTELLFSDILEDCSAAYLAALCSCLVPHRKSIKNKDNENLYSNLIIKIDPMKEIAGQVKEKMSNNAIPFNENGFIDSNVNTSTFSAIYYFGKWRWI